MERENLHLELFHYRHQDDVHKSEHHRLLKTVRKANQKSEGENSTGWRRAISGWLFAQFRRRDAGQQPSDSTKSEQWIDAKA